MPLVGTGHLWLIGIILIIVLIVWGPGKLPDVGSGMGRAIREFRKASSETKAEFARATSPEAGDKTAAPTPVAVVVPVSPVATAPVDHPGAEPAAVGAATAVDRVAVEGDRSAPN